MSLTNEMTIVRWLQSNEKEIVVKNRQEIADILYTDIGLRISASSVNRFLGAAGITLRVGKNGRGPAGKSGNNSVERDVCLAKILRKIGLDLDDLEQLPRGIEEGNRSPARLCCPSRMTDGGAS